MEVELGGIPVGKLDLIAAPEEGGLLRKPVGFHFDEALPTIRIKWRDTESGSAAFSAGDLDDVVGNPIAARSGDPELFEAAIPCQRLSHPTGSLHGQGLLRPSRWKLVPFHPIPGPHRFGEFFRNSSVNALLHDSPVAVPPLSSSRLASPARLLRNLAFSLILNSQALSLEADDRGAIPGRIAGAPRDLAYLQVGFAKADSAERTLILWVAQDMVLGIG